MRKKAWTYAVVCLVSGCASLQPGTSREADALAYFGRPASQFSMPDGSRALDFPRAPSGHENWRVIIGPDGVVQRVEQLLDEEHFAQIKRGMLIDEVRRALGRHGEYSAPGFCTD